MYIYMKNEQDEHSIPTKEDVPLLMVLIILFLAGGLRYFLDTCTC